MKMILEATDGPGKGAGFELERGRAVMVGRSAPARFRIPADADLSPVHFTVEYNGRACTLRDAGQAGGTYVNGKEVSTHVLSEGDEIQAGKTTFRIVLRQLVTNATPDAGFEAAAPPPPTTIPRRVDRMPTLRAHAACRSGVRRLVPAERGTRPSAAMRMLNPLVPGYALIALGELGKPLPSDAPPPAYLIDVWPEPVRTAQSPALMPTGRVASLSPIVDEGWGANAVVGLFSQHPEADLLTKLQAIAYRTCKGPDGPRLDGILGYYKPKILESMLTDGKPDFAQQLFEAVTAVMLESDDPPGWQLFGTDDFVKTLRDASFDVVDAKDENDTDG